MGLKDHPFFQSIGLAEKIEKKAGRWGAGTTSNKRQFFAALVGAHPFVFDRAVTMEKRLNGRSFKDFEDLAEEFSLPFKTCLYLMTDSPEYIAPIEEGKPDTWAVTLHGYLIKEIDPENFQVFEVSTAKTKESVILPLINSYKIDLKTYAFAFKSSKALGFEIFKEREERSTDGHVLKETSSIFHFTDCISVKRVGMEVARSFPVKSRGLGPGVTMIKYDNIIHIADKVEYEYVAPLEDSNITWDWKGFWRGHWRAFYVKDSRNQSRKDEYGLNIVDYGRIGKDRKGVYCVPGYTWVVDHAKGNATIADIKTRSVRHG